MHDLLVILAATAISICSLWFFRVPGKDLHYFATAGASVKSSIVFFSLAATVIGPGLSMGFVSKGFDSGWLFALAAIAYAIQLLFVGSWVAPRLRAKFPDAMSIAEVVACTPTSQNNYTWLLAGLLSFLVMLGVTAVMIRASASLLCYLLPISLVQGAAIATMIVAAYSYSGGVLASIRTDVVQFWFFATMVPLVAVLTVFEPGFHFRDWAERGVHSTSTALSQTGVQGFMGLIFAIGLGDFLQPPIVQRLFAAKDAKSGAKAFIATSMFVWVWALLMCSLGIATHVIHSGVTSRDTLLIDMGAAVLPDALFYLYMLALLFIVMSSHDSLLSSNAVVFARDIVTPFKGIVGNYDGSSVIKFADLHLAQFAIVLCSVLGFLISVFLTSIMDALLFLASIWAPAMIVPIIGALLTRRSSSVSGFFSMLSGAGTSLTWQWFGLDQQVPAILVGSTVSALAYLVTEAASRQRA